MRRCRHQLGTIAKMPNAQPRPNAARTTKTIGARHSAPKNQRTCASCWLLRANANRVMKTAKRTSQTIAFIAGARLLAAGVRLAFAGSAQRADAAVDRLAQRLAGLEVRNELFGDHDLLARARIAADARRPPVDREAAEAADLDAMALGERRG